MGRPRRAQAIEKRRVRDAEGIILFAPGKTEGISNRLSATICSANSDELSV